MTERDLSRRARHRLAVLRHVEEVRGSVAATCRYYGISRQCENNSPWYSMTTREITPMYTRDGYEREALAVAAARLSHQALSWSDRTRYPAPLHAALQMDLGHPQFRRSEPKDPESLEILREAREGDA